MQTGRRRIDMSKYSEAELRYCDPIAAGLINDPEFRAWLVSGGQLGDRLAAARLDPQMQRSLRSKVPDGDRWWFNYWAGSGTGIETDILMIFISPDGQRTALHVEVKTENDGLRPGQAEGYQRRVKTWASPQTRPNSVPPHNQAFSVLVAGGLCLSDLREAMFDFTRSHAALRNVLTNYPKAAH